MCKLFSISCGCVIHQTGEAFKLSWQTVMLAPSQKFMCRTSSARIYPPLPTTSVIPHPQYFSDHGYLATAVATQCKQPSSPHYKSRIGEYSTGLRDLEVFLASSQGKTAVILSSLRPISTSFDLRDGTYLNHGEDTIMALLTQPQQR